MYVLSERNDDIESAKVLIDNGSIIDPSTCRPLFASINGKNLKITKYLKEKGAAINGNEIVPSALQVAISGDDILMCQIILEWPELQID